MAACWVNKFLHASYISYMAQIFLNWHDPHVRNWLLFACMRIKRKTGRSVAGLTHCRALATNKACTVAIQEVTCYIKYIYSGIWSINIMGPSKVAAIERCISMTWLHSTYWTLETLQSGCNRQVILLYIHWSTIRHAWLAITQKVTLPLPLDLQQRLCLVGDSDTEVVINYY